MELYIYMSLTVVVILLLVLLHRRTCEANKYCDIIYNKEAVISGLEATAQKQLQALCVRNREVNRLVAVNTDLRLTNHQLSKRIARLNS